MREKSSWNTETMQTKQETEKESWKLTDYKNNKKSNSNRFNGNLTMSMHKYVGNL